MSDEEELYHTGKLVGELYYDPPDIQKNQSNTIEDRITQLEEKLNLLLAPLETYKKITSESVLSNQKFLLTSNNCEFAEADPFGGWVYLLGRLAVVKPSGAQDVNPMATEIIGRSGRIKALLITSTQYGQSADAAVEFPIAVIGGHPCANTCTPRQGLWFSINNLEII